MPKFSDGARRAMMRRPIPAGRYRYIRRRWRLIAAAIDAVGTATFRCAQAALGWVRGTACREDVLALVEPRRILLVQLDHLGDAVISTAMLRSLRQRFPTASIEVLASEWTAELFSACGEVDYVHVSRRNRFARGRRRGWTWAMLWWGWKLRNRKFDIAIDVRGEFPLALVLWLSGARRRVGWASGGGGFLLTDSPPFVPGRPEVESRRALLAAIGCPAEVSELPRIEVSPAQRERMVRRLASTIRPEERLVVVHVGAGTDAKRWPISHHRELLGRLVVELGARVVLVGSQAERKLAQSVLDHRAWPGVADWTGELGLLELAALVERADVFVGGDSGPAHLAAAVGTPVVVLFSGTNVVSQWQPRGRRVEVLRREVECSPCHRNHCGWRDHPCMARLEPVDVLRTVSRMLAKESPRSRRSPSADVMSCATHGESVAPPSFVGLHSSQE